jgi:hypothetical protein
LAKVYSQPLAEQRVGRRVGREHAQTHGMLDPVKLVKGYNNSKAAWRWNGVSKAPMDLQLVQPESAIYCSTLSKQWQFAAVAAEFGYHSNKNSTFKPTVKEFWNPHVLFPPTTVLVDMRSPRPVSFGKPVVVFDPCEEESLNQLADILGPQLRMEMTEQLLCIYQQAPINVREELISEFIARELDVVIQQGRGILSMGALLDSPSYALSAWVGNACLGSDIGIKTPSARNHLVPQQAFLGGSVNVILPVEADGSTGLELNGVWDFDVVDKRFEFTPAFMLDDYQNGKSA